MDLFSTDRLLAVIEDLRSRPTPNSLLSLFFPSILEEQSEEIHFDTENKPRRIAPFVAPLLEGKVVESQGFTTKTFQPAYVKMKTTFDPKRPLKRLMGEPLTGNVSPEQRIQIHLAMDLADHIAMIRRRKLVMASEALRLGTVTVAGDGYDTKVVNFGRDAELTIDLSGGAAEWDDSGISPINDLEDWSLLMAEKCGCGATDAIFDVKAWRLFKADSEFKNAVDLRRVSGIGNIDMGPRASAGLTLRGTMGDMRLWTCADWYVNDAGSEVKLIPDNTVILGSGSIEGQQAQGAIIDHDAGYQAFEFYPKSWTVPDPSVRYLLTQSAPLVVPYRPNASLSATVT